VTGGLAGIATMADIIRGNEKRVLLVDCGALFSVRKLNPFSGRIIASLGFKAMQEMEYGAMTLGREDFSFGAGFIRQKAAQLSFPLITTNIVDRKTKDPLGRPYAVVTLNGLKVGILGILPQGSFDDLPRSLALEDFEILAPEQALTKWLPVVKKEADMVVLLSQCGLDTTRKIVDQVEGVQLAIVGQGKRSESGQKEMVPCGSAVIKGHAAGEGQTLVVQAAVKGASLGSVQFFLDESGRIQKTLTKMIPINSSVPPREDILAITGENVFKKIGEINQDITKANKSRAEKEREKIVRDMEIFRNLSPEQYINQQLDNRAASGEKK
jgi:2',3'-cyclic-nucleotide 2'-phosphodiesterase (5'-nucleotidase family)